MPTMAATAMAVMATVDSATDMERGPLMPMPTMAAMVMAVMDTVDSDTATERGLLMLTMAAMAMAVLATAMVLMATASNLTINNTYSSRTKNLQISILDLNLLNRSTTALLLLAMTPK